MIVKEKHKTLELKPGAIPKYKYLYVVGLPGNNGTIHAKDYRGRRFVSHLLGVDVVKK